MSRHRLLRLSTLVAFSLGAVLNASALVLPHEHEDDSVDICGHKDHDGLELRAQAATRSYWQDAHAADPDSWVRCKILGFNDFHGHPEPRYLSFAHRYAGGAAVLGSYLEAASARSESGAIIVHAGGDNFTVPTQGTNRVIGPVDLDALITYVGALPQPISAAVEGRIQLAP
jgi:2',3'-cyclic-nucleotide 2'-phosphodiesterase (5'-nucleotidase family)